MKKSIIRIFMAAALLISLSAAPATAENILHYEESLYVVGRVNNDGDYAALVVKNNAGGGKKDGIVHIEQTEIMPDGTYSFKVPFSVEEGYQLSDYSVTVNQAGKVINNTITTAESIQSLVKTDCVISEADDGTVTATAQISKVFANVPDGKYSIKLVLAFYNADRALSQVVCSTFSDVDVSDEILTKTVSAKKPADCEMVKAFAFESLTTLVPLADYARYYSNLYTITCWGDSMTAGGGVSDENARYPSVLQSLVGDDYTVYNMGVGGETVSTIAARQGGITMNVANSVTLPAEVSEVEIELIGSDGSAVHPLRQRGPLSGGINPCTLDGIEGELIRRVDDSGEEQYYFKRTAAGKKSTVLAGTSLITEAMRERREDIIIIFAGHNGQNYDNLLTTIDRMIEYLQYDNPKYLIIGVSPHSGSGEVDQIGSGATRIAALAELEEAMVEKYGENYFNLREYMTSEEAFIDAQVIATDADDFLRKQGYIPASFRTDGIHYNELGYRLLANKVYEKLVDLGYVK